MKRQHVDRPCNDSFKERCTCSIHHALPIAEQCISVAHSYSFLWHPPSAKLQTSCCHSCCCNGLPSVNLEQLKLLLTHNSPRVSCRAVAAIGGWELQLLVPAADMMWARHLHACAPVLILGLYTLSYSPDYSNWCRLEVTGTTGSQLGCCCL